MKTTDKPSNSIQIWTFKELQEQYRQAMFDLDDRFVLLSDYEKEIFSLKRENEELRKMNKSIGKQYYELFDWYWDIPEFKALQQQLKSEQESKNKLLDEIERIFDKHENCPLDWCNYGTECKYVIREELIQQARGDKK